MFVVADVDYNEVFCCEEDELIESVRSRMFLLFGGFYLLPPACRKLVF